MIIFQTNQDYYSNPSQVHRRHFLPHLSSLPNLIHPLSTAHPCHSGNNLLTWPSVHGWWESHASFWFPGFPYSPGTLLFSSITGVIIWSGSWCSGFPASSLAASPQETLKTSFRLIGSPFGLELPPVSYSELKGNYEWWMSVTFGKVGIAWGGGWSFLLVSFKKHFFCSVLLKGLTQAIHYLCFFIQCACPVSQNPQSKTWETPCVYFISATTSHA